MTRPSEVLALRRSIEAELDRFRDEPRRRRALLEKLAASERLRLIFEIASTWTSNPPGMSSELLLACRALVRWLCGELDESIRESSDHQRKSRADPRGWARLVRAPSEGR
jgi:hypothetical protein